MDFEKNFQENQTASLRLFFQKIWPFDNFGQLCADKLTQLWTICEALLKLAGSGWSKNSAAFLQALPYWQACGVIQHDNFLASWQSLRLDGGWLSVAWPRLETPEIKLLRLAKVAKYTPDAGL